MGADFQIFSMASHGQGKRLSVPAEVASTWRQASPLLPRRAGDGASYICTATACPWPGHFACLVSDAVVPSLLRYGSLSLSPPGPGLIRVYSRVAAGWPGSCADICL